SPKDAAELRVRPLDESHVGEAVRAGHLVVTDLTRSRVLTPAVRERVAAGGYHTQLALPITVDDRIWGVMALISREPRTFDGEGLVGTVVATREPLTVSDVLNDPRTRNVEELRAEGTASAAIVPLLIGDRVLGALSVGVRERHEYTGEELSVLASLTLHAAN